MNLEHIKYQENDPELQGKLYEEAYLIPGSILNIDLEILLCIADDQNLYGQEFQNYRMNLNI